MATFARGLHYVSIVIALVIGLSWALFTIDELSNASKDSRAQIADAQPGDEQQPAPVKTDDDGGTSVRSVVDDISDQLTSPFDAIVDGAESRWVRKTVPSVIGLLLYGLGLAMISRAITTRN